MELARFANLEPGGMDSGKIIDRMEGLLAARVTAKAELRQKARDKEIEVAEKAVDALNETAKTFYGIEESQAEITGEFRGEDTAATKKLTFEQNQKLTEMYGGQPPEIFTMSEFKAAFNAVEGDAAYKPEFDRDNDGVIDFGDFMYMTENATLLPNGSYAYGETLTLEARKLSQQDDQFVTTHGLDEDKFKEAKSQFRIGMARDMDKFLTSELGQVAQFEYDADGNFTGEIVYTTDPVTGEPLTTLQKAGFEADVDHWEQQFKNHISEFEQTLELSWAGEGRLSAADEETKNQNTLGWVREGIKAAKLAYDLAKNKPKPGN